jgi:tetratricopeptide (TPR) repeat protein
MRVPVLFSKYARKSKVGALLLCPIFFVSCNSKAHLSSAPSRPDDAVALNNSALEYKKQGNFQAAERSEEQAVQIFKTSLGEDHPDTAKALGNYAEILAADGKTDQALPLYTQSISIQQKTLGPDHPDLAASYASLGDALIKEGRHEEGLDFLHRAHDIDVRILGPDNISTGEVLLRMADAASSEGNKPLAQSYLTQIGEIIGKNSAKCSLQTPVTSDCDRVKKLRDDAAQSRARAE